MAYQQQAVGRPVQEREWSSGLCNCSPCTSCLLAACLPCLLLGQTSERIRDPTGQTHDMFNSDCILFTAIQCFTGLGCLYSMMKRTEIRERYGIKGSGCGDYCTSYWCMCCALIQQDNEVAAQNAAAGYGPNTQGYQANKEGMHMPGAAGAHPAGHPQQQQQQQQQHPEQYGYAAQSPHAMQYPAQSPPPAAYHPGQSPPPGPQGYAFQPQSPPPMGHDQISQQQGVIGSPDPHGYPHGKQ